MMGKCKGFTLIELLVVIAIIAVLAAILLPVFISAKESANRAKCSTQLKQLFLAIGNYTEDYGGKMPGQVYDDNYYDTQNMTRKKEPSWGMRIVKYLRSTNGVTICPSNQRYGYDTSTRMTSYLYPRFCNFQRISSIRHPTHIVLIYDRGIVGMLWGTYPNPTGFSPKVTWDIGPQPWQIKIHNGGANYLLVDGHVKWMKPEEQTDDMFWESWQTVVLRK